MELTVTLAKGEDGYVIAECPMLSGRISQGRTQEEALVNIEEAIELWLETYGSLNLDSQD